MNRATMMVAMWMVLGMAALLLRLGFALVHVGVSRSKNVASSAFRSVMDVCLGAVVFWFVGAAILSGSSVDLMNVSRSFSSLFVVALLLTASSAVIGSTLERSTVIVPMVGTVLMCAVVGPLGWQWAHGAWLTRLGFVDLGGATFIHFAAGCAAAVAAGAVGARTGKYNRDGSTNNFLGHSVVLASAGVLMIFAGWIPYITGCLWMNALPVTSAAVFNVVLGGAGGAIVAAVYSRIRLGEFDIYLIYAGLLGGLVSITAAADRIPAPLALATGAVAGLVVPWFANWLDMVLKIDDPGGAVAIQGIGGLWAALAAALFIPGQLAEHLHRLTAQCIGVAVIGGLSAGAFLFVMFMLRLTGSVRCREADEFDGLDLAQHDVNAYPDFQQTTIKSYHLREM